MSKVPVQKGPIDPNPMTSKQMNRMQKEVEKGMENMMIKRGQTLDLKVPKK